MKTRIIIVGLLGVVCFVSLPRLATLAEQLSDSTFTTANFPRTLTFLVDTDPTFAAITGFSEGNALIPREANIELFDIRSGETTLFDVEACAGGQFNIPLDIEGSWILSKARGAGSCEFGSYLYNRDTQDVINLLPEPPRPDQPDNWWPTINNNRVLWSAMDGCENGDLYLMDLADQSVRNLTNGQLSGIMQLPVLHNNWVAWDQLHSGGVSTLMLRNLDTGETIELASNLFRPHHPTLTDEWLIWREIEDTFAIKAYSLETGQIVTLLESEFEISISQASGRWLVYARSASGSTLSSAKHTHLSYEYGDADPCLVLRDNDGPIDSRLFLYDLQNMTSVVVRDDDTITDIYDPFVDEGDNSIVWMEWTFVDGGFVSRAVQGALILDRTTLIPVTFKE